MIVANSEYGKVSKKPVLLVYNDNYYVMLCYDVLCQVMLCFVMLYCLSFFLPILGAQTARSAQMKLEMKEKTMKRFLLSQRHILHTEPLDVQAGSTVTVFYNSSGTVLSGKPNVWFRCSFNHWTYQNGSLPPLKMVPTGDGSLVKASGKNITIITCYIRICYEIQPTLYMCQNEY